MIELLYFIGYLFFITIIFMVAFAYICDRSTK